MTVSTERNSLLPRANVLTRNQQERFVIEPFGNAEQHEDFFGLLERKGGYVRFTATERFRGYQAVMDQSAVSYKRQRFPSAVIAHAVWLFFRFPLSLRLVEEML